jgi:hypothetical protein
VSGFEGRAVLDGLLCPGQKLCV